SLWQMVERVVDLHGIEMTGVVGKPTPLREIPRVEDLLPVVIVVARGSDSKLSSFDTHASVNPAHPQHRKHTASHRPLALLPVGTDDTRSEGWGKIYASNAGLG